VAALDIFEGRRRNLYTHQSSVMQQQSSRTGFWLNVIVIDVVVFDEVKDNLWKGGHSQITGHRFFTRFLYQ